MKKWFLDKLDQSGAEPDLQTKSSLAHQAYILSCHLNNALENTTKDFWVDPLDYLEDFFSDLESRIESLIFNAVSLVQTEAKKIDLKVHGIDQYQIVLSDNTNVCDRCKEMDGQIFNVDELKVGVTAPPFHPNCGCTIIMKRTIADIDEPLDLVDPSGEYDREEATQYAMQWFDGQNPEYPSFGDSGDCANFVSQCLVAAGFKMNEYWHCYDKNEINPIDLLMPNLKWSYTEAWSVAKDQYEYLKNSDMITQEVVLNSADEIASAINDSENPVKVGDVMYLQWDHDYPHHATIISKVEDGMIYYAAHTRSVKTEPLSNFFAKYPEGQAYILKIK